MSVGGEGYVEEDRLPWLETVDEEYREGPSILRILLLILLGFAVIAAATFGYWQWSQSRHSGGTGALIAAPEEPYKVKPDQPGGMKVEGEGDTVFATSEGSVTNGSVDLAAVPEAPVAVRTVPTPKATQSAGTAKISTAVPVTKGDALQAKTPVSAASLAPRPGSAAGGALVQLGSFPSEAGANGAWTQLSKRFGYIANLGKSVEKAEVNGRTVYRLRVNAGSAPQAKDICGRLKVAGESCFVAR